MWYFSKFNCWAKLSWIYFGEILATGRSDIYWSLAWKFRKTTAEILDSLLCLIHGNGVIERKKMYICQRKDIKAPTNWCKNAWKKCWLFLIFLYKVFTAVENVYKYISKLAWFYFCITTRTSSYRRGIMLKYYKYVWKNYFLSRNWQQSENRRLRKWLGLGRGSDQLPCTQGQGFQWFFGLSFGSAFLKSSPRVVVHRNSRL